VIFRLVLLTILAWFVAFRAFYWACGFSLLLDDLLEIFVGFRSSSWASWGLGFELQSCVSVVNRLIKGKIEKPSGQFLGLIVMSH
jgi:hypothetical protein